MAFRLAKALETLRSQVNAAHPTRRKASDGWIGDTAHSARKSDHNPNSAGVVCALDMTHDPGTFDAHARRARLRGGAMPGARPASQLCDLEFKDRERRQRLGVAELRRLEPAQQARPPLGTPGAEAL